MKTRWPHIQKISIVEPCLERRNDDRKLNTLEHVLQVVNKTNNVVGGLFQISVDHHETSSLGNDLEITPEFSSVSHRLHFDIT